MNRPVVRTIAALLALIVLALLVACGDGYPRADRPSDRRMTASTHLQLLNRSLAAKKRKLTMRDACHLVLSKPGAARPEGVLLPLRSTSVVVATDSETGRFLVKLVEVANGQASTRLRLAVGEWLDAVAWRSHFQQLQMRCAATQASTPPG